jgi:predicted ATPase
LLRSTRQQHHQRIAQVLETRFPGTVDTQPELLAHHYTKAGLSAQAIPYWQRAGQRAIQRSANVEATNHLTKGLEVLKALPYTLELTREELELQTALGLSLIAIKGYGAPEVEEAYIRARQLCQQVGENPPLFPVLRGLWNCYLVRAELQTARDLGKELLSLAQRLEDSALLVEVYRALGTTLLFLGDLASARAHLEQGMALYDPQQHRSLAFRYGADPGVICQLYAAWTLWLLGYPDQALQRIHDALTLTYELAHAFSLAFALNHAAVVHMLRREERATQEQAEASITFSTEQRIAQWLAQGVTLRGWALAAQGQGEEGIVQIRQGLAAWRATGAELTRPYWLALLADAYGKGRRAEEGLQVLAEALAAVKNRGSAGARQSCIGSRGNYC